MATGPRPPSLENLDQLPRQRASDVKRVGWRGIMRALKDKGKVLVTNHDEPEAVILSAEEYTALVEIIRGIEKKTHLALHVLRERFDQRLAGLQASGAGDRLRSVMRGPANLSGRVKAGARH